MVAKGIDSAPPAGFRYRPDLLRPDEERTLVTWFQGLPLTEFNFHGYLARRRIISFGWRYSYDDRKLSPADPIPEFLLPVRERAARFAELPVEDLVHATVTEYTVGTPIGWHRDRPVFGDVVGVSLNSSCVFRLRRKTGATWERFSRTLEARSVYVLRGPTRTQWEHSIPPVEDLRYSITFRTLR